MTITICPRCQSRIISENNVEDIEHTCNSGNLTLDQEDVPVIEKWEDYTGSGVEQNVNGRGLGNRLWGSRAWIEGENPIDVTKRGNNTATHRIRQHIEFVKIGEQK